MDIFDDHFIQPEIALKRFRILAALIDFLIFWFFAFITGMFLGEKETFEGESGTAFKIGFSVSGFPALLIILIWFLLFSVMEGLTGQTVGKKIMKLKVVGEDFSPNTIGTSFVRHLFDTFDLFLLAGLLVASTNKKKQRIGDLVAKSLVVRN